MTLEERFWRQVQKTNTCWLWTGSITAQGYGQISLGTSGPVTTHRLSWQMANGPIPAGLVVMHRCDVRPCVRPDHLMIGTHANNVQDKVSKNRHTKGSQFPQAKLREHQIPEIRALLSQRIPALEIAARYQVSAGAIHHIRKFETWAHIPPASD